MQRELVVVQKMALKVDQQLIFGAETAVELGDWLIGIGCPDWNIYKRPSGQHIGTDISLRIMLGSQMIRIRLVWVLQVQDFVAQIAGFEGMFRRVMLVEHAKAEELGITSTTLKRPMLLVFMCHPGLFGGHRNGAFAAKAETVIGHIVEQELIEMRILFGTQEAVEGWSFG